MSSAMRILTFSSPPLTVSTAHMLTVAFALTYVGSIYLSKAARLSFSSPSHHTNKPQRNTSRWPSEREKGNNERWRDDPDVIRARLVAVSSATLTCCLFFFGLVWSLVRPSEYKADLTGHTVLARLGLTYNSTYILPYLPVFLLFTGPLYTTFLEQSLPFQVRWGFRTHVIPAFGTWQGLRNYIVAPITEELVFRGCVLAVYQLAGAKKRSMIFLSPFSFGAAHVHHAWDSYNRHGRTAGAAKLAILMSLFQLAYTTLFGFYSSFLFLRTSSIYPSIVAHVFCNLMGLPQLTGELRRRPKRKVEIIAAYILGIVLFAWTAADWTQVGDSVYWTRIDKDGFVRF